MRVYEVITESQNLEEGPLLNKIGSGIGKAAGTVAKGIGAVAGGAVGAFKALKKGYQAGKATVGGAGDDDEEDNTQTGTNKKPSGIGSQPSATNTTGQSGAADASGDTGGTTAAPQPTGGTTATPQPATGGGKSTKTGGGSAGTGKYDMKTIKASIQALPKRQRASLRKIVAAKAGG